jgi:TonB family protein
VEPQYPQALVPLHLSGTVRLQVTISPKGSVENIQVLGGNPLLAQSAVMAVKQWVYAVGRSRVRTVVSLSFDPYR